MFKRFLLVFTVILVPILLKAQQYGDPPPSMPGLQIERSDLFKKFPSYGINYKFEPGKSIDKQPTYVAVNPPGVSVLIVGKEDDLRLAKFSLKLSQDTAYNHRSMKEMTGFVFAFGYKPGMDWFFSQVVKRNAQPKLPLVASQRFNYGRDIKYEYLPAMQEIVITVTPF